MDSLHLDAKVLHLCILECTVNCENENEAIEGIALASTPLAVADMGEAYASWEERIKIG